MFKVVFVGVVLVAERQLPSHVTEVFGHVKRLWHLCLAVFAVDRCQVEFKLHFALLSQLTLDVVVIQFVQGRVSLSVERVS